MFSMFKHIPNGRGIVYCRNGEDISELMEHTLMVCIPNGKDMVLWKIAFGSGNRKR